MNVSVREFFALLKNGLTLRSSGPLCGEVCVKKIKGKRYLYMSWPEDEKPVANALGDFKQVVRKPEKMRLEKFERFATRLFHSTEFFVQIIDPDSGEVVWKRK